MISVQELYEGRSTLDSEKEKDFRVIPDLEVMNEY